MSHLIMGISSATPPTEAYIEELEHARLQTSRAQARIKQLEEKQVAMLKDTVRLGTLATWAAGAGDGAGGWVCRDSTNGRGIRLHQDTTSQLTIREALDTYITARRAT